MIEEPPYVRYAAGVLFPQEEKLDESGSVRGVDANDVVVDSGDYDDDIVNVDVAPLSDSSKSEDGGTYDDTVTLANQYKPSAIALTFAAPERVRELAVQVNGAEYGSETRPSSDGRRQNSVWKRRELRLDPVLIDLQETTLPYFHVTDGLKLCLLVSAKQERRIVTISLYNDTKAGAEMRALSIKWDFQ